MSGALVKAEDAVIKPENVGPSVDTSTWPLLLKNWDQRTLSLGLLHAAGCIPSGVENF